MRCIYICILSASCEQDCNFVSTRVCILVGFSQVIPPHSQCLVTSTNSTCVTSKYSVLRTTSIIIFSHCVWCLTRKVPLSPSHRVVYLACTVLLSSVLLLPDFSLTQCKRSTLFISSHTSRRDVFLCITLRSHSVFFILVAV